MNSPAASGWRVEPATPDRWPDVVALFGTKGDASRCWCRWFIDAANCSADSSDANRQAFREEFDRPTPPGVLAYADDQTPVGWLRVGPLASMPRVTASRTFASASVAPESADCAWHLPCFVVKVSHRRKGVSAALVRGAVELARTHGATVLLARPFDLASVGRPMSGADLYPGALSTFKAAGFTEYARSTTNRPWVSLDLGASMHSPSNAGVRVEN